MFDDDGGWCTDAGQCADACLYNQVTSSGYCTSMCGSGADCPAQYGCFDTGSSGKACFRTDQVCDSGQWQQCLLQQLCDTQTLLVGACTMPCKSAGDCPQRAAGMSPSWYCQTGVCVRPDDVWGPLSKGETAQWACFQGQVVNLCADALTFDTKPTLNCPVSNAQVGTKPCVLSCRYGGGCGAGWACVGGIVAIQPSNLPIPICVRAGTAEIGQPCGANEDCLFGLCDGSVCSRDCTADGACPHAFSCVAASPAITVEGKPFRICK
jgi:hypothetical protein